MDSAEASGHRPAVTQPRMTAALVRFELHIDDETSMRLLSSHDADVVYDVTVENREHLAQWMTWADGVVDASDTYAYLRTTEREAHEHTAFKAGIWRGRALIGAVDLHEIDWRNGRAKMGYWLAKDFTGDGVMTRAVALLAEYAFEALDLHRLEIHVATENYRSRRIPERLGFALEGVLRHAQRMRGRFFDHALYALIKPD